MNTFVYFIRPIGQEGPIKIGYSNAPRVRLEGLMAWSPAPLEIITTIPGDLVLERRIQGLFAAAHLHHEWFKATPELTALIAALVSGRAVGDLINLAAPILAFRTRRKPNRTEDRRRFYSYSGRIRWAFPRGKYPPRDVAEILFRWSHQLGSPQVSPTSQEIERLDQVLADPMTHGVSRRAAA